MNEQQRERFYRFQNIRLERELDEMESEEREAAAAICYVKPEIMTIEEMRIVFLTYKDVRLHPESTLQACE